MNTAAMTSRDNLETQHTSYPNCPTTFVYRSSSYVSACDVNIYKKKFFQEEPITVYATFTQQIRLKPLKRLS